MVAMWHVIYVFCLAIISFYDSERKFSMPGYPLPYIHPCVTEIMTTTMHCRGSVVHFEIIFNLITDCLILHLLMSLLPKWNDIQFYTEAIGQSNEKSLTSANLLSRKHWTNIAWWFTTIKDFFVTKVYFNIFLSVGNAYFSFMLLFSTFHNLINPVTGQWKSYVVYCYNKNHNSANTLYYNKIILSLLCQIIMVTLLAKRHPKKYGEKQTHYFAP